MPIGTLDHVLVVVRDLDKSRTFWGTLLPSLGYRMLFDEQGSFGYRGADGLKLFFKASASATPVPPNEGVHFAFNVPDRTFVETLHGSLAALGSVVLTPPTEHPEYVAGYYSVVFRDPDGREIEVVYVPAGA